MVMLPDGTDPYLAQRRRATQQATFVQPPGVTAPKPTGYPGVVGPTPGSVPNTPTLPRPQIAPMAPPPSSLPPSGLASRSDTDPHTPGTQMPSWGSTLPVGQRPNLPPGLMVNPGTGAQPGGPFVGERPPDTGGNAGISEFGPGNDIRFAQINPQASDALTRARTLGGQGLESLYNAPDRGQIAASQLDLLTQQSEPAFQRALQSVGQRAAAQGRLGAGMTTSDLYDVVASRERALSQARQGLAADTAGQTLSDRLNRLNATQGYAGDVYGQEAAARGELRGERGYQADTANQALQNRVNQRLMEENLLNSQFGRQATRAQLGLQGSELYGEQANQNIGGAGDLIGSMAFNDQLKPANPSAPASPSYTPLYNWQRRGGRYAPAAAPQ